MSGCLSNVGGGTLSVVVQTKELEAREIALEARENAVEARETQVSLREEEVEDLNSYYGSADNKISDILLDLRSTYVPVDE